MPRRIDIDGGDPQDEIEKALRQLTQRQRPAQPQQELDRAVQEVAEQQKEEVTRRQAASRPWVKKAAWAGISVAVLGLIAAIVIVTRPEPPPPPAPTAEDAVRGFWNCIIDGKYEAAISYYPELRTLYGSSAQAGGELRQRLSSNPPTSVNQVGPAEPVAGTTQYKVPYEVYLRSGQPRIGRFLVNDTGSPSQGFVIVEGGV